MFFYHFLLLEKEINFECKEDYKETEMMRDKKLKNEIPMRLSLLRENSFGGGR